VRFDRLDLNLLAVLDVLIEERGVSTAAKRLNLTQPAVTNALKRLRAYFGDDLLVAKGRQMLLTPRAEELAGPVRHALMHIRAEITKPGGFDPSSTKRCFFIVASDYAYTVLVAPTVVAITHVAPGVTFEIIPPGDSTFGSLDRAEVDLILTVEEFSMDAHPKLPLFEDEDVVIAWKEAGYPRRLTEEAFFKAAHVISHFGHDRRASLSELHLSKRSRQRDIALVVPNFTALPQSVVGTRRIAVLHRLYAQHFSELYPISIHLPPIAMPKVVELAQWHRVRDKDPGIRWLISQLQDQANRLPGGARFNGKGQSPESGKSLG
jgi:LysR family nod box-dependent transcriptional activator